MHILIVAEADIGEEMSGTERVVAGHASELVRRGHRVTVMAFGTNRRRSVEQVNGVDVRHFTRSLLSPWVLSHELKTLPHEAVPDVLLVYQPFVVSGIPTTAPWRGLPLCYVALAAWEDEYGVRQDGLLWSRPWVPIMKLVRRRMEGIPLHRAGCVVVLSRFTRACLQAAHPDLEDKFAIVPGGVDVDRFCPTKDQAAVRRTLGLSVKGPLLLTVRNLEPRMGLDNLLHAYRIVRQQHQDVELVIGGTGPLEGRLRRLAADLGLAKQVQFVGYIPDDRLPAFYQAADLFVLPTTAHEGFGLVTVEALACGTPVLGTPVGATPEILGDVTTDLLAADASPPALTLGISKWLDRTDKESMRALCRATAVQRYSWRVVGEGLEEAISVAHKRTSSGAGTDVTSQHGWGAR